MYRRWYKSQNEFRQFVTPNTESWADEKAIIDSMNDKDRDYASGSRSNMKYQYIYKEDGKPVGFVDLMEDTNNDKNNVYMFIGINPKLRGKGIFTKLIDKACNWLNTHDDYKTIMYYINKDNIASIQAISKIHTFKRQKDAYGKVVFKYDRVASTKESYTSETTFPIECIHPQETEYTCGPACARTLVHYYTGYVDETEQDVATIMGTSINTGTTMDGMVRYFKDHLGWKVNNSMMEGSPSTYDDFKLFLDYNLSHGMCIIVENKAFGGYWRIIVGFNEDTDTLTMVDPYNKVGTGVTIVNARDFFITWYDTNLGSYKAWVTSIPYDDIQKNNVRIKT